MNQAASAAAIEDAVCANLESRFRWHGIFDLVFLHKLVSSFFSEFLEIDSSLRTELVLLKNQLADQNSPTTHINLFLVNSQ